MVSVFVLPNLHHLMGVCKGSTKIKHTEGVAHAESRIHMVEYAAQLYLLLPCVFPSGS